MKYSIFIIFIIVLNACSGVLYNGTPRLVREGNEISITIENEFYDVYLYLYKMYLEYGYIDKSVTIGEFISGGYIKYGF